MDIKPVVYAALGLTRIDTLDSQDKILEQFRAVKGYIELLEDYQKGLRIKMFEVAEQVGDKDEKGSSFVKMDNGFGWKKEARTPAPKVIPEKALDLMKYKGLNHRITIQKDIVEEQKDRVISLLENTAPELVKHTEIVNDSDLETAFINQEISDAELKGVIEQGTTTYALKMIEPKGKKK